MTQGKAAQEPVFDFDDWYKGPVSIDQHGSLVIRELSDHARDLRQRFERFKTEHAKRVFGYDKYEMQANAEVASTKPDLPNVSSGDVAGMVRRTARNVVQHTPNVEVVGPFDDDLVKGVLVDHILRTRIIGDEFSSNDMQQNLFSSVKTAFTLGFDAVVPVLKQRADGAWVMEYDALHYRDVFPEPGVKDARNAPEVFVRRYLTKGEVHQLLRNPQRGWDERALKRLCKSSPPNRQQESGAHQDKKAKVIPDGYEIVTWYNAYGDPFLTFSATDGTLLRVEKNKDPLKRHPVHFLILEKDSQQPLGTPQLALIYGRQEFQDLMLNGAMKQWYRNINPSLIGYGTGLNGVPNLSPGKFTNIPNPNARLEAFEVNTQTLLQYGAITQQNLGSMVSTVGAADQQMAASAGSGMSATPQGVDAQEAMVDITTNNYQKAVENFFSRYCSHALTVYLHELSGSGQIMVSADVRKKLTDRGVTDDAFDESGNLKLEMKELAAVLSVRCVPGSLVELEDEKQLRILNQLFVPLSQAMPALAQMQDQNALQKASAALQFILVKEIELSGSAHSEHLGQIFGDGVPASDLEQATAKVELIEGSVTALNAELTNQVTNTVQMVRDLQGQMSQMMQLNQLLLEKLGMSSGAPASASAESPAAISAPPAG